MVQLQIRCIVPWLPCFKKRKCTSVVVTCVVVNKQIKIPSIVLSYRLYSIGGTQNIPENVCSFGNGTPKQWAPTENVPV